MRPVRMCGGCKRFYWDGRWQEAHPYLQAERISREVETDETPCPKCAEKLRAIAGAVLFRVRQVSRHERALGRA